MLDVPEVIKLIGMNSTKSISGKAIEQGLLSRLATADFTQLNLTNHATPDASQTRKLALVT